MFARRRTSVGRCGFLVACILFQVSAYANPNVYVTRFWHNHQPIYWPEWNGHNGQTERGQYAWDSIVLKPTQTYGTGQGHPDNNLTDIFGLDDRKAAYQGRPRDSLNSVPSHAGYSMSYSGSLIDNARNLGAYNQLGYGGGWWDGNREASGWTTPSGGRRLDLLGFTYHHSLGAVLPKSVLRKEIQIFKQAWWKAWDKNSDLSDHSKGFFPTEMAFSTPMVDVLADEGYEWVIVASHHLSRTCPTYIGGEADPEASYLIKSSPPNRADQLGPSPTSGWWFNEPNPGQAARNVAPFAYQLHRVKYVNPSTGQEKSLVVVPSDDALSYVSGYSGAQVGMISGNMSPYATDPAHPIIAMPSTDGDNAWGGGYDSWMISTPGFFGACQGAGYKITTVQDFVSQHAGAINGYTHVEDGAWIFPESDYGSPYFLKWVEPPVKTTTATNLYPGTLVDLETPGFALKFWSWAPVMAGANWCETAEQLFIDEGGSVQPWKIQAPYDWNGSYTDPNVVERAWHIYLAGLDSGFNYYGGLGNDDEVKPSLATRRAIELLQTYVGTRLTNDRTPPTVFKPQRFPWNPGGYTFGWFNSIPGGDNRYLKEMPSDFYIWTHAYDVSGVQSVTLKVRLDNDGANTLDNNQNETYAGGGDVGSWISIPMTKRVLPKTREELNAAANNGQIDYFITPPFIADYYFAKITQQNVPNFRGKLLDYYIEAMDVRGNATSTDIQHVYVEDDGGGSASSYATFSADPRDCAGLGVTFHAANGPLQGVGPVYQQVSFDNEATWNRYEMTNPGPDLWNYTNAVPDNAPSAIVWFENGDGSIVDSNGGNNWSTSIRDCDAPVGPSQATIDPPSPDGCGDVTLRYYPNEGALQNAANIYIHIGRNGWTDVLVPDPLMTKVGTHWEYVYSPLEGTFAIDAVFQDGQGGWDNHGGADWHFAVANCVAQPLPPGIVITNPAAASIHVPSAVSVYTVHGTAGSEISGMLTWSNALTGASGTTPSAPSWAVLNIPLGTGTNIITVSAGEPGATTTVAEDDAADPAYDPAWDDGDDGGSGWGGGWSLSVVGNGGAFTANQGSNPQLESSSEAWGLWANQGGLSDAVRPFASAMSSGQVFSLTFENGGIDTGSAVGFGLQNAGGVNVMEFLFVGGDANYTVKDSLGDRNTGFNWRNSGLDVTFELTSSNTYHMQIGTANLTGSLTALPDQTITRFRAFNYNAGTGSDYDFFFNRIGLTEIGGPSVTSDTVTIIRDSGLQDGIPVTWWERYSLGPTNTAAGNSDHDPANNWDEWVADTDPTNPLSFYINEVLQMGFDPSLTIWSGTPTTNSRVYDLWLNTNHLDGSWTPLNLDVPGDADGTAVPLPVTAPPESGYYRSGVKVP